MGAMEDGDELTRITRKYLDLWLEHWSASLAAPETAAAVARLLTAFAPRPGADLDVAGSVEPSPDEPAPLRASSDPGGRRVDELEGRVADLERRLAEFQVGSRLEPRREREIGSDPKPAMARPAARPRRGARPVRPASD